MKNSKHNGEKRMKKREADIMVMQTCLNIRDIQNSGEKNADLNSNYENECVCVVYIYLPRRDRHLS